MRISDVLSGGALLPGRERHQPGHAGVARAIGIDIIAGRYPEGAKLPGEAELMPRFGLSRPVLRESVRTLVAKGLLTTRTRVGTVVRERAAWNMFDPDVLAWHLDAGIDERFLSDLAEIRLAVEPRAAALAAQRRSEAALARMRQAVARMEEPARHHAAPFAEADLALHLLIAEASGNAFMISIGAVIEAALRASFRLSAPSGEAAYGAVVAAHRSIVDAIALRDAEKAAAAMVEVIFNGLRRRGAAPSKG
ncbi:FadR family transcriptional regulator [Acetobacteraceae bacterium H6797]|nr:FadR family transcriptional regulator [Acetobacteraceae bacterium H6797]